MKILESFIPKPDGDIPVGSRFSLNPLDIHFNGTYKGYNIYSSQCSDGDTYSLWVDPDDVVMHCRLNTIAILFQNAVDKTYVSFLVETLDDDGIDCKLILAFY